MPLGKHLANSLRIPVVVESDRNAALHGECWRGAGKGKSDVIVMMIGTGIGAGIMSGGYIVRGAHELSGCAGWLSALIVHDSSASVLGELECHAAGPGIVNTARARLHRGETSSLSRFDPAKITAREVAAAARGGDRLALDVFNRAGRLLGIAVANMVSLFDPQIIILGGGMATAADLYLESLCNTMQKRAQPLAARQVKLVVSKLGERANLLGCARLAWLSLQKRNTSKGKR
jgi:glucokinase